MGPTDPKLSLRHNCILNPAFKTCFLYPGTCYDPPYAITPASSLSPLTTPSVRLGSPPTPGPKPKFPNPSPTSTLAAADPKAAESLIAPVVPATISHAGALTIITDGYNTVDPEPGLSPVPQLASTTKFDPASPDPPISIASARTSRRRRYETDKVCPTEFV